MLHLSTLSNPIPPSLPPTKHTRALNSCWDSQRVGLGNPSSLRCLVWKEEVWMLTRIRLLPMHAGIPQVCLGFPAWGPFPETSTCSCDLHSPGHRGALQPHFRPETAWCAPRVPKKSLISQNKNKNKKPFPWYGFVGIEIPPLLALCSSLFPLLPIPPYYCRTLVIVTSLAFVTL